MLIIIFYLLLIGNRFLQIYYAGTHSQYINKSFINKFIHSL